MNKQNRESGSDGMLWFGLGIIMVLFALAMILKEPAYKASIYIFKKTMVAIYFIKNDLNLDTSSISRTIIEFDNDSIVSPITYTNLWELHNMVGTGINSIIGFLMVLSIIYILIIYRYENKFTRTFDLISLKKEYSKINPKILPTFVFPPFTMNKDKEPFTRSETPWEFGVKHGIISSKTNTVNATRDSFNEDNAIISLYKQCGDIYAHPIVKDGIINMSGSPKIILGILCAYHERQPKKMKELVDESGKWFKYKKYRNSGKTKFWMDVPKKYMAIIDRVIIQAFTNSSTIDDFERERRIENNDTMINKIIRNAYFTHDFTYTFLMSLFQPVTLVSTSDIIWLKAINRPLYYGLNHVGRPSPLTRALGISYLYNSEITKFKNNQRLFDKDLNHKITFKTKMLLDMYEWDEPINDLYYAIDDTAWVHHTMYKDIEDDDLINLREKDFSYDNQAYILIIKQLENKKLKTKSIHFKKQDGSHLMDAIYLNESEILDIHDAARLKAVIDAFYIYVNDMKALSFFCNKNNVTLGDIKIIGYNLLPDALEVMGSTAKSWYSIMKEVDRINEDDKDQTISKEDLNWGVVNSINDVIGSLYEPTKQD